MAQTEVADFGLRKAFKVLLRTIVSCLVLCLEEKYIVNFYVCVDNTSLVHVPDSVQYIMGPDNHFLFFYRFILHLTLLTKVVTTIARILHVNAVELFSFTVVMRSDDIGMIHLQVHNTFTSGENLR